MHNAHTMHKVENAIENYKDKRSSEEIYQTIINRLKVLANNKLSDQEVHLAARNFIGFCQVIINYKIKKQKEKRNL